MTAEHVIESAERNARELLDQRIESVRAVVRAQHDTAAAEAAAQTTIMRSRTCPECFTVRSPSGACACE